MSREVVILIDSDIFREDEKREERIDALKRCSLRVLAHLHHHLKMRWCFRTMERDQYRNNHIQLLDFNMDSMERFEKSLRISNETSIYTSSGSDVSALSKSPMTLKILCRSISNTLEHIDAARLDPLLSVQRKVSRRNRTFSGLASTIQTAIFLFGEVPTVDSEFCEEERVEDYTTHVCDKIRRLGFQGRKLDTVSLSWIDLSSPRITNASSYLSDSLRTFNGAVIPSNVLLDKTFRIFPLSAILRHCTTSSAALPVSSSAPGHEIHRVEFYIESERCSATMTRVVTTSTSTCPYVVCQRFKYIQGRKRTHMNRVTHGYEKVTIRHMPKQNVASKPTL